ncbi:MAG TPA: hypothetical protein V6D16_02115 [Candidatus Obscuribacterales bacterium]
MNDSSPSNDANAIGIALLCGICLATGIALGGNGRDSDQALIAKQEQQISQLQWQLAESKAKFEGYMQGRR